MASISSRASAAAAIAIGPAIAAAVASGELGTMPVPMLCELLPLCGWPCPELDGDWLPWLGDPCEGEPLELSPLDDSEGEPDCEPDSEGEPDCEPDCEPDSEGDPDWEPDSDPEGWPDSPPDGDPSLDSLPLDSPWPLDDSSPPKREAASRPWRISALATCSCWETSAAPSPVARWVSANFWAARASAAAASCWACDGEPLPLDDGLSPLSDGDPSPLGDDSPDSLP